MLIRLLQLCPAVHAVCQLEDVLRPLILSSEDWKVLEHLKTIMEIFVKATQYLSGSTYPTLSSQLPYFNVLATQLEILADELPQSEPDSDYYKL